MLETLKTFVKGVIRKMFPVQNLKQIIDGNIAISETMLFKIELWVSMNKGMSPWTINDDYISSLRLENGICREFSNVCLNEMETNVSNTKLNEIYQAAILNLNENLQAGLALGSFIIKPLGENKVEYITPDRFIPLEFDARGRLMKVVFIQTKQIKQDSYYFRLEYHILEKQGLVIRNKAYHSSDMNHIGSPVALTEIEEWAKLPEHVLYAGVTKPDFGYYRNPIKNEVDGSHCGVSIFDSAIDLIKRTDTQFSRLDWEFESGERAVHVDNTALQAQVTVVQGKQKLRLPKLNKRLYRGLNIQPGSNEELFKEYSPEFREQSIIAGINAYLRRIEFNVSLSYGDLSDAQDVEKTATECLISKKRKYNMVSAIQKNLKECLEELVYALAFYNRMTQSGYQFFCDFKDSILTDEEMERQQDRQDVSMGVMQLWEYRAKWYGESEEVAKSMIPEQADTIDGM